MLREIVSRCERPYFRVALIVGWCPQHLQHSLHRGRLRGDQIFTAARQIHQRVGAVAGYLHKVPQVL